MWCKWHVRGNREKGEETRARAWFRKTLNDMNGKSQYGSVILLATWAPTIVG
jgi:hypothetical protein